ncbi:MAG: prepilin-type N-terminal cleavage/methylation domain-containing protein [Opitutaceae bacterium]|jgi:prepilin-type N-terminal cleavage/methylation domain-containing protein|nr:prepilin-type N-terminal cleavage/methylation domain-containing protein [Opitutaceae bacterium]
MKKLRNFMPISLPSGFTLIELLAVITIIGVLAAILIPVVSRVRFSARAAQCRSNIRQIVNYMVLGANDNRGSLVDDVGGNDEYTRIQILMTNQRAGTSIGLMTKGDEKILVCPVNRALGAAPLVNPAAGASWECSYSACRKIFPDWDATGRIDTPARIDTSDSARIPVIWDQRGDFPTLKMNVHHSAPGADDEKSATFGYLDGSVRFLKHPQKAATL